MSWIKIDADSVLPPQAERLAIVAAKGTDDLPDIVVEITNTFRMAIASRGFELGPDGTVPTGLNHYVSAMALWHFVSQGMTKNENIQTQARREADTEARKAIEAIYAGKMAVEPVSAASANRSGCWNSENKLVMRAHPVPTPRTQFQSTSVRPYANPDGPADL